MGDNKINVRIPDGVGYGLSDIEAKAKSLGLNKSEFIMKGISMMMNFDDSFIKRIQNFAEGMYIPEWLVIQNMLIKRIADEVAEYEVFGGSNRFLDEFMFIGEGTDRRLVTGEELHNILKEQYVMKYETELVEIILNDEKYEIPLDENKIAMLIKHKRGRAWLESDEYKKEIGTK